MIMKKYFSYCQALLDCLFCEFSPATPLGRRRRLCSLRHDAEAAFYLASSIAQGSCLVFVTCVFSILSVFSITCLMNFRFEIEFGTDSAYPDLLLRNLMTDAIQLLVPPGSRKVAN